MGFELRAGLSFCHIGTRPIFLDLVQDRYFALAEDAAEAFQSLVEATTQDEIAAIVDACPALRPLLIARSGASDIMPCRIGPPARQVDAGATAPCPSILLMIRAAASLLLSYASLRSRGLHGTIAALAARKRVLRPARDVAERQILAVAAAFMTIRAFTTTNDTCLCRSIAMASVFYARAIPVDLVFGVSARPFSAHCWVQHQDRVLNDTLDNVRRYQPIFAL